jgi:hypothetical protein
MGKNLFAVSSSSHVVLLCFILGDGEIKTDIYDDQGEEEIEGDNYQQGFM